MIRTLRLPLILLLAAMLLQAGCSVVTGESVDEFTTPAGQPVIYTRELYTMQGIENSLYVYEDGTVLYVTETGLRFPSADHPAVRTWYRADLTTAELTGLLDYFREINFDTLRIPPFWDGTGDPRVPMSDLMYTVAVSSGNVQRELTVSEYFPPTRTDQTAIMPAPMDAVYNRLAAIAAGATEFRTEEISR